MLTLPVLHTPVVAAVQAQSLSVQRARALPPAIERLTGGGAGRGMGGGGGGRERGCGIKHPPCYMSRSNGSNYCGNLGRSASLPFFVLPLLLNQPIASPEGNGNDWGEEQRALLCRNTPWAVADRSLSEKDVA